MIYTVIIITKKIEKRKRYCQFSARTSLFKFIDILFNQDKMQCDVLFKKEKRTKKRDKTPVKNLNGKCVHINTLALSRRIWKINIFMTIKHSKYQ